jgi:methionine sulfoxide reductase heme-binding subunit
MPYSIPQILLPFISAYRPFWIGVGVISMYLMVLVTVTFYIKNQIGIKAFRAIHVLSLLGYLAGLAHSFFSGTDSSLLAAQIMYAGTFLVTVFLFVYWLVLRMANRRLSSAKKIAPTATPIRPLNRRPY